MPETTPTPVLGVSAERRTNPTVDLDKLPPSDYILLYHYPEDHFDQMVGDSLDRAFPIITTSHAKDCLNSGNSQDEPFQTVTGLDFFKSTLLSIASRLGALQQQQIVKVTGMSGKHVRPGLLSVASGLLGTMPPTNGWLLELGYLPLSGSTSGHQGEFELSCRTYISGHTLFVDEPKDVPKTSMSIWAGRQSQGLLCPC